MLHSHEDHSEASSHMRLEFWLRGNDYFGT
jgi:hypothetical protein